MLPAMLFGHIGHFIFARFISHGTDDFVQTVTDRGIRELQLGLHPRQLTLTTYKRFDEVKLFFR